MDQPRTRRAPINHNHRASYQSTPTETPRELFEANFPADFVAEGLDQTRGWFYTLMVLSTALFDRPAFKNLVRLTGRCVCGFYRGRVCFARGLGFKGGWALTGPARAVKGGHACWAARRAPAGPNPPTHPPTHPQVCNGLVLAADGKKMSKRLKNYPVGGGVGQIRARSGAMNMC